MIHYLQRAWAAIELERWELAHEEVLRGLADEPNDVRLHILLAEICYRTHDYGDGRAAARNAIALWPESGRAYYWLAANVVADFLEPDRATRAGEIADQAIACDPDDVANYSLRAQIALFAGDPDAAFRFAENGLRLDPQDVGCLQTLGEAQQALKLDSQAETTFRKILELEPEHVVAHQRLSAILLQSERFADAYEHARTAIRLNPESDDFRAIYADVVRHQHPLARCLLWSANLCERFPYVTGVLGVAPLLALAMGSDLDGWKEALAAVLAFVLFLGCFTYPLLALVAAQTVIAFSRRYSPHAPELRPWRIEFAFAWVAALATILALVWSAVWRVPLPILLTVNIVVAGIVVLIARRAPTRGACLRSLAPVILPVGMLVAALLVPIPQTQQAGFIAGASLAAWALTIALTMALGGHDLRL